MLITEMNMEDQNKKAVELLDRYLQGVCTPEECAIVEAVYKQYAHQKPFKDGDVDFTRIGEDSFLKISAAIDSKQRLPVRLWPRIAAAASILLIISFGGYFLLNKQSVEQLAQNQQHDIAPGTNHAVLKIGRGKTVVLDSLAEVLIGQQANTSINKTADGALVYSSNNQAAETQMVYDTLIVPAGSKPYRLTLSDGTKLLVNVDSKVRFPERFAANERKIDLISGEAYFDVVHNATKPLSIVVKGQTIKDIGTHFNINAYDNEPAVVTTLLEGSVSILKGTENRTLAPGEQAIVKPGSNIVVKKADTEETMAWKDGKFLYNSTSLGAIMKQVERWYGVKVVFEDDALKSKPFSVISTRFGMASQVLHNLEMTGEVKFKIEDKKIIVVNK